MNPKAHQLLACLVKDVSIRAGSIIRELVLHIHTEASANAILHNALESLSEGMSQPSGLESWLKLELRRVHGKAADYLPYLFESLCSALGCSDDVRIARSTPLSTMVAVTERLLGPEAKPVLEDSLRRFIAENDVRYRMKSA